MKHYLALAIGLFGLFALSVRSLAQPLGDACSNPYTVFLQDPKVASCDFVEISGLDFTNFNDNATTPSPSCNYGSNNNDIWVTLTIPANADGFKITMDSSVTTSADNDYQNFEVAVYTGTSCAGLSYKTCKSSSRARVYNNYFDGYSPGDVLYVRIYTDNSPSGTWDKPFFARFTAINTVNSNDACSHASSLIPGNYCNHLATDKGESDTKAPDKLTSTNNVCSPGTASFGSFDNNQWYYFSVTASTPQPVVITISNVTCSVGDKVLQAAIWKANTLSCSTWGGGYNLSNPSAASEGDLLACAVGAGSVSISENLPVGNYWYTVDGSAGSFCEYSITDAPIISLVVRLLQFYGVEETDTNILFWSCSKVSEGTYFEVEKSLDGIEFTKEGIVLGSTVNSVVSNYRYEVEENQKTYYRIKIIEPGESPYYSEIIFVGVKKEEKTIRPWYNSEKNELTLHYFGEEPLETTLQLYDSKGALILNTNKRLVTGENIVSFSTPRSAPRVYFLTILSNAQSIVEKIWIE